MQISYYPSSMFIKLLKSRTCFILESLIHISLFVLLLPLITMWIQNIRYSHKLFSIRPFSDLVRLLPLHRFFPITASLETDPCMFASLNDTSLTFSNYQSIFICPIYHCNLEFQPPSLMFVLHNIFPVTILTLNHYFYWVSGLVLTEL